MDDRVLNRNRDSYQLSIERLVRLLRSRFSTVENSKDLISRTNNVTVQRTGKWLPHGNILVQLSEY
jgi:hypothetical protein